MGVAARDTAGEAGLVPRIAGVSRSQFRRDGREEAGAAAVQDGSIVVRQIGRAGGIDGVLPFAGLRVTMAAGSLIFRQPWPHA